MQTEKTSPATTILSALGCSVLVGAAHLSMKWGADRLRNQGWDDPTAIFAFLLALVLMGVGLALFLVALRGGLLSTVYPILAARYIWVVAVSPLLFTTESLNFLKIAGAVLAAVGVAIVARTGARQ